MSALVDAISTNRLRGEPCPRDLQLLIENCPDLIADLGISLGVDADWAPWSDKSYLTPEDLANPDITANVKAIDEVCEHVRFVAQLDGGECIGYWVSPTLRPIAACPVVYYDTEGQFELCGGRFVESLFFLIYDDDALEEVRLKCAALGIPMEFSSLDDIKIPESTISPDDFHDQRYTENLKDEQVVPPKSDRAGG